MKLDNVFKKTRLSSARKSYIALNHRGPEVPEGLLRKCNKCGGAIIAEDVKRDIISVQNVEGISGFMPTAGSRW